MRRNRRKVTWLPVLGTVAGGEDPDQSANFQRSIDLPLGGIGSGGVFPLLFDQPQQADTSSIQSSSLADFVGSEYILKRLVGKVFCTFGTGSGAVDQGNPGALVTAGFFVARATDGNPTLPIGFTSLVDFGNYSPDDPNNLMEPWIWRRTWILGSGRGYTDPVFQAYARYPRNNTEYGSAFDGPHLDAKTGRRVGQDDRLWFGVAVRSKPLFTPSQDDVLDFVQIDIDLRALGTLVKAHNRSTF